MASANIARDQYSDRSKGFWFVEMPKSSEANTAISGLDGKELSGRALKVNEARPKPDGNRRFGGAGRRGGGYGRGRY